MGSEESTSYNQTKRGTNTGNSESYDHSNTNHKGENLILKCQSYKGFSDDWVGNILFVKIDFKTSQVLMKEPANDKKVY